MRSGLHLCRLHYKNESRLCLLLVTKQYRCEVLLMMCKSITRIGVVLLSLLLLLTGCARLSTAPTSVSERLKVPALWLTCSPEPIVSPTSSLGVLEGMFAYKSAYDDCAGKVTVLRGMLEREHMVSNESPEQ